MCVGVQTAWSSAAPSQDILGPWEASRRLVPKVSSEAGCVSQAAGLGSPLGWGLPWAGRPGGLMASLLPAGSWASELQCPLR